MRLDEFIRYANIVIGMGVKGIIISGGGEPTLNPDFDSIAEWLEKNGVHYGINTNFNVLKYIKPDYIKVSLDGWDEDSYSAVRGSRMYYRTRENIIRYDKWRRKESPGTLLGIQKVVLDPDEIVPFFDGNRDLPFDYMSLRPVESVCGEYYSGERRYDSLVCKSIISGIKSIDDRVDVHFKWDMVKKHFCDCYAHWATIFIDEHGNVIYCCDKPHQIIGHITDDDIRQKIDAAKTDMQNCVMPCRLTGPNAYLEELPSRSEEICFI